MANSNNNRSTAAESSSFGGFIDKIPKLELKEIYRTEFFRTKWEPIISIRDKGKQQHFCNICRVIQFGIHNMYQHLGGKKHKSNMTDIKYFYHPFHTKSKKELTETQPPPTNSNNQTKKKQNMVKAPTTTVLVENLAENSAEADNKDVLPDGAVQSQTNVIEIVEAQSSIAAEAQSSIVAKAQTKTEESSSGKTTDELTVGDHSKTTETSEGQTEPVVNHASVEVDTQNVEHDSKQNSNEEEEDCVLISADAPQATSENSSANEIMNKPESSQQEMDTNNTLLEVGTDNTNKNYITSSTKRDSTDNDDVVVVNISQADSTKPTATKSTRSERPKSSSKSSQEKLKNKIVLNPIAVVNSKGRAAKDNVDTRKSSPKNARTSSRKFNLLESPNSELMFLTNRTDLNYKVLGFLGVEYVIKIKRHEDDPTPRFECTLCELVLMAGVMQNHLLGYNHRLKYCEKHFPTAIRHYRQYISNVPEHEVFKVMTPILQKLAVAIENHHGKDLPYSRYDRELQANRNEILQKIHSGRHASEQHGPTFTHAVDAKEIDGFIENRHNFRPISALPVTETNQQRQDKSFNENYTQNQSSLVNWQQQTHQDFGNNMMMYNQDYGNQPITALDNETHRMLVENFLNGNKRSSSSQERGMHRDQRKRRRVDSVYDDFNRDERRSVSPLREGDIWQAYRHMVDQKIRELDIAYKLYRSDPEQHPLYDKEWQQFWKRRKDELIASGIDHRNYNYQNEWSLFFKVRIEELYNQRIEHIKIESRERLCLPMTNSELENPMYHVHVAHHDEYEPPEPPIYSYANSRVQMNEDAADIDDTPQSTLAKDMSIIHVLRILTALEEHLGSLGPKITQMLSKALLIDKTNPKQTNMHFNTSDNCTLLETAKEKLKGLVYSGILDAPKERALRKAIEITEMYLNFISQQPSQMANRTHESINIENRIQKNVIPPLQMLNKTKPTPEAAQSSSVNKPQKDSLSNLSNVDKNQLAVKLASSLMAQGRTEFGNDELQRIIQIYNIFEKKSQPNTTNSVASSNVAQPQSSVAAAPSHSLVAYPHLNYRGGMPTNNHGSTTNPGQNYNTQNVSNFPNRGMPSGTNSSHISSMNNMNSSGSGCSANQMQHFNNGNMNPNYQQYSNIRLGGAVGNQFFGGPNRNDNFTGRGWNNNGGRMDLNQQQQQQQQQLLQQQQQQQQSVNNRQMQGNFNMYGNNGGGQYWN